MDLWVYVDDIMGIKSAFKHRTWLCEDHWEYFGADVYQRGPPGQVEIEYETRASSNQ